MSAQRLLHCCVLVLFAAGCASTPNYVPVSSIPAGSRVHLVIELPQVEPPDAEDGSESVGRNVAAGAAGGAAVGAAEGLKASLECGKYVVFCAPVMLIVGAAAGTVAGTTYGVIKGSRLALPAEKAEAIESIINATIAESDFAALIEQDFVRNNAGRWQFATAGAPATVTIGIEALYLKQSTDDNLSIELQSYAQIQYGANASNRTKRILFQKSSDEHHVDHWIADNGAALRTEIVSGIAEVTRQMNSALVSNR